MRFGYCGTGVYIFLNFSKIFVSAHFFYRLFLIDFNHGIRLGHCAPSSCRNLGLKQFLTHGGIRDTSEKNPNHKKMGRLRGWQGVLSCKNFKSQNQFLLIKMIRFHQIFTNKTHKNSHENDDSYLKIVNFDHFCKKKIVSLRDPYRESP